VKGQLVAGDAMFGGGVFDQLIDEFGIFGIGDAPADDPAAEDVDDDVEVEVGPLLRALEFGDAP